MELKHSRLGIASFILSLAMGLLLVLVIAAAGLMAVNNPDMEENEVGFMVVGFLVIGCALGELAAIGLGIAGLCQRDRKKVFAVLGLVFSVLTVVGTLGLMVLGTLA